VLRRIGMDMDSNEDPFRIPPEVLAAIGQVAVNAATLETVMVGVVLRPKLRAV